MANLGDMATSALSGKTLMAGATSALASIPTAIAAASTPESWTAIATGAAVSGIAAVVFLTGVIKDKGRAAVREELEFIRARNTEILKELDKAEHERRMALDQREVLTDELTRLRVVLTSLNQKIDASRCPIRSSEGIVPCGVVVPVVSTSSNG